MVSIHTQSPFLFLTCQPGAEALVKADIQSRFPALRFAFSRPGYMTYKSDVPLGLDVPRPSLFARTWGLSFGWKPDVAQAWEFAQTQMHRIPDIVHLCVRESEASDALSPEVQAREETLAETLAGLTNTPINRDALQGQVVLDLIEIDPERIGIGAHFQSPPHRLSAAGRPPFQSIPDDAPSRVWGKVSEAFWRTKIKPNARDILLDIGCAPGGGTRVLLDFGAQVIGVDSAEMHPSIRTHRRFHHLPVVMERLDPKTLPAGITGVVYDVNLSPKLMLGHLADLLIAIPSLRWGFFTLKLNQPSLLGDLKWMLKKIRAAGFSHLFVEQLAYNRQELFCFASKQTHALTEAPSCC